MRPYAERGLDLYQTPPAAVRALTEVEPLVGPIWECACGPGSIVRVLRAAGHRVVATDFKGDAYGCPDATGGIDFLTQTAAPVGVTAIVTNPPYMHAAEFVRHALRLVPRVIMLLPLRFLESQGRSDILDGGQLARVLVFRNRVQICCDDPRENPMALAWFVWSRDHRGPWTGDRISWRDDEEPATELPSEVDEAAE
jgi:hypothetical protein